MTAKLSVQRGLVGDSTNCPGMAMLHAFTVGTLAGTEAEAVSGHLETCPHCEETVQEIEGRPDPLLAMLRLRSSQGGISSPTWSSLTSAATHEQELLNPPKGPDELGWLAHYRIIRLLGRGGMGIVFQAEDTHLHRDVAIKLLRPELARDPIARQRFLREARALAAVKSDHLVTIHHIGQEEDTAYIVMDLLQGESLEHWLGRCRQATLAEILRIGRQTTEGLAAAHACGLLHRDIKPANLWLESLPSEQADAFRVKILDFGLARGLRENVEVTPHNLVLGTPAYLAPEQFAGAPLDARSDLFSLGCVLYRLATGELPFQGDTPLALVRAMAVESPRPVCEMNLALPSALGNLIQQLLAQNPAQRPSSAAAVAETLKTIEEQGEAAPTHAVEREKEPPSAHPYRRWLTALGAIFLLLVLAAGVTLRIATSKGTLEIRTEDPKVRVIVEQNGELITIMDLESKRQIELRSGVYQLKVEGERKDLRLDKDQLTLTRGSTAIATVRRVESPPPKLRATLQGHASDITSLAFTRDSRYLASGSLDNTARIWDIERGVEHKVLNGSARPIQAVTFSPDDKTLAAACDGPGKGEIWLWDLKTGKQISILSGHPRGLFDVAFSPDGKTLASGGWDRSLRLWDVASKRETHLAEDVTPHFIRSVLFSPDGETIAIGGGGGAPVQLWDKETFRMRLTVKSNASLLAFSKDGKLLAGSIWDAGAVDLIKTSTGKVVASWKAHPGKINRAAFSPDTRILATPGDDGTVRLWSISDQRLLATLKGHERGCYAVAFSPDGRTLACANLNGTIQIWDVSEFRPETVDRR